MARLRPAPARRRLATPISRSARVAPQRLASRLVDRLDDLVGLQPFLAALGAEARILDPAERRVGDRNGKGVDPDHTAFDKVADHVGAAAVLGEGEGGEAEWKA